MTPEAALALAPRAAALWGAGQPEPVKVRENAVFRMALPDGRTAALRLHRPDYQTEAGISAELTWTAALANGGFAVPLPAPTLSGQLTGQVGGVITSAVHWMPGTATSERAHGTEPALYARIGALLGDLHNRTDRLAFARTLDRPHWDLDGLLGPTPLWGRFEANAALSADDRSRILKAMDAARERLAGPEGADRGLIHADVLRENLLERPDGTLALIDFDDSGHGYRLYDLGTALVPSLEDPGLPDAARALAEGYGKARGLPPPDTAALTLHTFLRSLASCGWITSRAGPGDPRLRLYATRARRMADALLGGPSPLG